jgi:hypothetical protein
VPKGACDMTVEVSVDRSVVVVMLTAGADVRAPISHLDDAGGRIVIMNMHN